MLTTAMGSDVDEFAINGSPFQFFGVEGRPYADPPPSPNALPFHRQTHETNRNSQSRPLESRVCTLVHTRLTLVNSSLIM